MSKIKITVEGCTGVGKSAVSQFISEMLEDYGFATELHFINDEHPPRNEDNLMDALDSIRGRLDPIAIEEIQTPRTECS